MWLPYWRPNSIASSTGLTASSSIVIQSCVVDQGPVRRRQAGEIHAPLRHPGEVALGEALAALSASEFGEVESALARDHGLRHGGLR
jgi:hypothetical protein